MKSNLILNKEELEKLSKPILLEHISNQIERIDKLRGYNSGVSKFQLLNYPKDVLINVALTNNQHILDYEKSLSG